jgi:hypothetical protein
MGHKPGKPHKSTLVPNETDKKPPADGSAGISDTGLKRLVDDHYARSMTGKLHTRQGIKNSKK